MHRPSKRECLALHTLSIDETLTRAPLLQCKEEAYRANALQLEKERTQVIKVA